MAPVYKLKYFDFMGAAEPIRYLFAYGGIKYDNVVISKTEWERTKTKYPFGRVPVLTVDDKTLFHAVAISRYIGMELGLVPTDTFLAAELDGVAATIFDFGFKFYEWHHETNDEIKTETFNNLEEIIPVYLKDFETFAKTKGGYFGGNRMGWTDFFFVAIMESVQGMWGHELLHTKYPTLYQMYTNVRTLPPIKTYISTRPSYKY